MYLSSARPRPIDTSNSSTGANDVRAGANSVASFAGCAACKACRIIVTSRVILCSSLSDICPLLSRGVRRVA